MELGERECKFCLRPFKDPKVLPCFHILCRECIRSLRVRGQEELKCPVDRCTKRFTCQDPENLPDASLVYHLQDLRRFKEKLKHGELFCDICFEKQRKDITAVASCDRCNHICQSCLKKHKPAVDEYSDHNVLRFDMLQQGDSRMYLEVLKRSRSMSFVQHTRNKCKVHPKNTNISFCLDCKIYVCPDCIENDHSKHHYRVSRTAASECVGVLNNRLPTIQLSKNQVLGSMKAIETQKLSIEEQKASLSASIDITFEKLKNMLQKRQEQLQSSLGSLTDRKLNNLAVQMLDMERLAGEMERMIRFTQGVLDSSTDRELLTIYPFLHGRIQDVSEAAVEQRLQPVEMANTAFKSSAGKGMMELCRKNLEVYSEQASPGTCSVQGEGLKSVQVRHHSQFMVNVVDKNSKPCPSIQDVAVKLKCCENGHESTALVHDRGTGHYRVSFCPEFRGRHEVYVSVNSKPITGSPFALDVHMSRSQLGIPQGSIVDVTQPRGIVIAPNGNIVISEWNGKKIIEMDRLGRHVNVISSDAITHPASLALGPSGDIFVVEGVGANGGVVKWDKDGKLLKSVRGEGARIGQFKNPRGVKIGPNNEVFVCDRDNRRIQIYDMSLNYLRCIDLNTLGSWHKAKPNDLTFDPDGNMYIADYCNHCIHQLNRKEEYVFTFSRSVEGPLAGPECIAIDDSGYLYVTESQSHRVSVFRTSGECVKAFGTKGMGEGEFNFPMGVAIDSSGSIYVCELLNNRIQVF